MKGKDKIGIPGRAPALCLWVGRPSILRKKGCYGLSRKYGKNPVHKALFRVGVILGLEYIVRCGVVCQLSNVLLGMQVVRGGRHFHGVDQKYMPWISRSSGASERYTFRDNEHDSLIPRDQLERSILLSTSCLTLLSSTEPLDMAQGVAHLFISVQNTGIAAFPAVLLSNVTATRSFQGS